MSKSVMLRTSNEDIKLNINDYQYIVPNYYLTNLPEGWCYVSKSDHALKAQFNGNCGCGTCFTNYNGTAFQIYICDDRARTYVRRCESGYTDLKDVGWTLVDI